MKRVLKWLLRVVSLALSLMLIAVFFPYVQSWVGSLMGRLDYTKTAQQLTHEMREVGKLVAVEYQDTGVMNTTTDALILGTVQRVSVPYQYDISLGIDLEKVTVEATETSITVYLPEISLIADKLTVTGEPQIDDFWHLMTEQRYQNMLDAHAAACRESYLNQPDLLDRAWDSAAKRLRQLFDTWVKGSAQLQIEFAKSI